MVKNQLPWRRSFALLLTAVVLLNLNLHADSPRTGFGVRIDHGDRPIAGEDGGIVLKGKGEGPNPKKSVISASGAKGQATSGPATPP